MKISSIKSMSDVGAYSKHLADLQKQDPNQYRIEIKKFNEEMREKAERRKCVDHYCFLVEQIKAFEKLRYDQRTIEQLDAEIKALKTDLRELVPQADSYYSDKQHNEVLLRKIAKLRKIIAAKTI